ncbi:MAG TPA: YCF48-related protein [Candidatus Binatia bacterium]|nr:YCF48-related protein [Candidatus Binatia bacterium]
MNDKLPKPMLDALASAAKPVEHPSADLLAAFAEQALTAPDKEFVADHLGRCAGCREVVFLASIAREASEPEDELVAAASRDARSRPVAPYAVAAMTSPAAVAKSRWWVSRWVWATSAAAVCLLVGGLFVGQRFTAAPRARQVALQSEPALGNRYPEAEPAKPSQNAAPKAAPAAPQMKTQAAAQQASVPRAGRITPTPGEVIGLSNQAPTPRPNKEQRASAQPAAPAADSHTIAINSAIARPTSTAPKASGFAPSPGQQQIDSLNMSMNRLVTSAARTQHSTWRISSQGQLEHLTADGWTRVLADQTAVFRVVSVVGSEVWAGGNDGMLFHSSDNGLQWDRVALANAGAVETGAIVSIRFSDAQNGEVETNSGGNYSTSNGGVTWTKQ